MYLLSGVIYGLSINKEGAESFPNCLYAVGADVTTVTCVRKLRGVPLKSVRGYPISFRSTSAAA